MTTIRYFIPEDGDHEHQPNVFLAPKSRQQGHAPTLGQIKQAFPLPGRYHFRFKSSLTALSGGISPTDRDSNKGNNHQIAVWMDCTDDRLPVPVWQSQIIAKITRIGVEDDDDDDEDDEDFRRPGSSTSATTTTAPTVAAVGVPLSQQHQPPHQQQQQQQQQNRTAPPSASSVAAPSFDLFGDNHTTTPAPAVHNQHHNMSANLFDTPTVSHTSSSLLDMNYHPHGHTTQHNQHHQSSTSTVHSDFLGMTTAPSPPVSGNYGGYNNNNNQMPQQQRPSSNTTSFNNTGTGAFGDLGWK